MHALTWARQAAGLLLGGFTLASAGSGVVLEAGSWGGDRMRLIVDAQGASVESDCASGRISGPIQLRADGGFVAKGGFAQHQPGPQAVDGPGPPETTRFSGTIKGDTMYLSILPAGARTEQHFTLRRGAAVKLARCL